MIDKDELLAKAGRARDKAKELYDDLVKGHLVGEEIGEERRRFLDERSKCLAEANKLELEYVSNLPLIVEGFPVVGDSEGWIGCPDFGEGYNYNWYQNVLEILGANEGKYLRVTIEEIGIDDRKKCGSCQDRFKCFTNRNE